MPARGVRRARRALLPLAVAVAAAGAAGAHVLDLEIAPGSAGRALLGKNHNKPDPDDPCWTDGIAFSCQNSTPPSPPSPPSPPPEPPRGKSGFKYCPDYKTLPTYQGPQPDFEGGASWGTEFMMAKSAGSDPVNRPKGTGCSGGCLSTCSTEMMDQGLCCASSDGTFCSKQGAAIKTIEECMAAGRTVCELSPWNKENCIHFSPRSCNSFTGNNPSCGSKCEENCDPDLLAKGKCCMRTKNKKGDDVRTCKLNDGGPPLTGPECRASKDHFVCDLTTNDQIACPAIEPEIPDCPHEGCGGDCAQNCNPELLAEGLCCAHGDQCIADGYLAAKKACQRESIYGWYLCRVPDKCQAGK